MDSASFFRDKSLGADSPISGLIALVAAVDALSRVDGLGDLNKQLVFLIFTGEAWGYLGSRRFLLELDLQTDAVTGLNSTLIDMVMEVGSVGKGSSEGVNTFYAHATMASSATNQTMAALQRAQDSLNSEDVKILPANSSNPGIPPSSLMAFLKKNTTTAGIVFDDFNTVFANKFYHSHLDDLSNVNSSSIEAASTIIARTLYILASKDTNISNSTLAAINTNVSLVEELLGCLLSCEPGLSCDLVKNYIRPTTTSCPSNYVGVFLGEPSSAPYPGTVNDVSRFLWNFLAEKTAISKGDVFSSCKQNCSQKDQLCVREKADGKGVCVTSTTRYVPAYSTRLKYESGIWDVLPADSSDPMGMLDPVWTESFWDVIGLRVYTVQDTGYDHLVLEGGIAVTVSAYVAIVVARAFITKALKRD